MSTKTSSAMSQSVGLLVRFRTGWQVEIADRWQVCSTPRAESDLYDVVAAVMHDDSVAPANHVDQRVWTIRAMGMLTARLVQVVSHPFTTVSYHYPALGFHRQEAVPTSENSI
ncbi:hypothetical protein IHQ68_14165 [Chelatococcus sambhunathii]|uniref:Uncharacterized protein n=1 Tax=Chelatococcus sambhunathii TaxID=363953 RepID=A0ABU1DIB6_9HYPH|nr:hypothetical protein [Chelatococcus sambhunathii]MDR4307765.1 hypothetical protein [Chelatococcus sambhunathii]